MSSNPDAQAPDNDTTAQAAAKASAYALLGGDAAVRALVDAFYDRGG